MALKKLTVKKIDDEELEKLRSMLIDDFASPIAKLARKKSINDPEAKTALKNVLKMMRYVNRALRSADKLNNELVADVYKKIVKIYKGGWFFNRGGLKDFVEKYAPGLAIKVPDLDAEDLSNSAKVKNIISIMYDNLNRADSKLESIATKGVYKATKGDIEKQQILAIACMTGFCFAVVCLSYGSIGSAAQLFMHKPETFDEFEKIAKKSIGVLLH